MYADAMGVVEVRAKDTDDQTEYVIYWYVDRIDKGRTVIKRIQVWDKTQTTYFVQSGNGQIIKDNGEPINPRPHIIYQKIMTAPYIMTALGLFHSFALKTTVSRKAICTRLSL